MVHLLHQRVLSPAVAALLWGLLARRASVLAVGDYTRGAGKTTTLSALAAFFPSDTELVFARGRAEVFAFVAHTQPRRTYIMVGEFSDHTPWYLWGEKAAHVFRLTKQGYAFAGTMHADSLDDLLGQLTAPPVVLSRTALAAMSPLVIMQSTERTPEGVRRRVSSVHWLYPAPRAPGGLGAKSLVAWEPQEDTWSLFSSPETWADLAQWAKVSPQALQQEVEQRERFLQELLTGDIEEYGAVRAALLEHHTATARAL